MFYNNIANARNNLGDYEEALDYHQRALDRRIEIYGERHPETAQSIANMATTFSDMERYEEALEYYNKALDIELDVYEELHPEIAYSYEAIGNVYKFMQEMDDAEQNYLKGYEILLEVLGEDHFETENARERLVNLYKETGQTDIMDALKENENLFGVLFWHSNLPTNLYSDKILILFAIHGGFSYYLRTLAEICVSLNTSYRA